MPQADLGPPTEALVGKMGKWGLTRRHYVIWKAGLWKTLECLYANEDEINGSGSSRSSLKAALAAEYADEIILGRPRGIRALATRTFWFHESRIFAPIVAKDLPYYLI